MLLSLSGLSVANGNGGGSFSGLSRLFGLWYLVRIKRNLCSYVYKSRCDKIFVA